MWKKNKGKVRTLLLGLRLDTREEIVSDFCRENIVAD
jgi:hypothetical protein